MLKRNLKFSEVEIFFKTRRA